MRDRPRRGRATSRRKFGLTALLLAASAVSLLVRPQHHTARAQEVDPALLDRIVASLTVDERVGQLVMVNFVGDDVSAQSDIAGLVQSFRVGSVLVTASNGNIVNRDDTAAQLVRLTNGLQQRSFEASRRSGADGEYFLPLFIATDNEGDLFPFTNVTNKYTQLPNNMTIGATFSNAQAEAAGRIAGQELSSSGINLLLGPVVDVLDNPRSGGAGDIGIRSFGGNPAWVGSLGRAYVRGVHEGSDGHMLTVAKHFPGHGGSDRSTDNEVPTVNKSLDQLRSLELAPFAESVRSDDTHPLDTTDAMMVSHIRYRNFVTGSATSFTEPISLDAAAFQTLMALPEFSTWRANHMVMADSLGVPAVKKWFAGEGSPSFPNRTVVQQALMAGSDLLPFIEFYADPDSRGWKDYQLPLIQDSIIYMRQQYTSDVGFQRRADDALRHVIAAKLKLYPHFRLDETQRDAAAAARIVGGGADAMRRLSEASLTLLQPLTVGDLRARLPRGPLSPDKVLIVECWDDCYPYRVMPQRTLQEALIKLYGPSGAGRLQPGDVQTISFGDLDRWLGAPNDAANKPTADAVSAASWVIFALSEYNPIARPASDAAKRFLDAAPLDVRNKNLVAIAYNAPYHLDSTEISKLTAYFAVYNKTDYAIETSFRALYGDVTPAGHSPVNVIGTFYDVREATQPDPSQHISVSVYGQDAEQVRDARVVGLVAGPIVDRNGSVVPDGTAVTFALTKEGAAPVALVSKTADGIAGAQMPASGGGTYTATATVSGIASDPLTLRIGAGKPPEVVTPPETASSEGGSNTLLLALAIGAPVGAVAIAGATTGVFVLRRRRQQPATEPATTSVGGATASAPAAVAPSPLLVDADTRRVYVHGSEARPPLSNEQFRLLAYLYERSGKVVPREELVRHVWPEAHTEGVSEEALDALVRRVRERIAHAGGERSYIVTLRGQGFRLDV